MKSPGTILVVDDSEDIRYLVATVLRSIGYETVEAANGVQALELLNGETQIHMVITDYDMPEMDGLELTRRIRRDERLEDLPVLMQTASGLDCLEPRAEAAGVTRLLSKPINPRTLSREIDRILSDVGPGHVWRALLVGLSPETASTLRSTLSDAGFQVLQAHDELQARELLQRVDGIDLVFETHADPDSGQLIRAHLLRNTKDFNLFRLVLMMDTPLPRERSRTGFVCVAGYLMNPVSPEKVTALLRRLGLSAIHKGR